MRSIDIAAKNDAVNLVNPFAMYHSNVIIRNAFAQLIRILLSYNI